MEPLWMLLKEVENILLQKTWASPYIVNTKGEQDLKKCWECS